MNPVQGRAGTHAKNARECKMRMAYYATRRALPADERELGRVAPPGPAAHDGAGLPQGRPHNRSHVWSVN